MGGHSYQYLENVMAEKGVKKKSKSVTKDADVGLPTSDQHIMISYDWDHQPQVLKMHEVLKKKGYRTWLDVEQMNKCG